MRAPDVIADAYRAIDHADARRRADDRSLFRGPSALAPLQTAASVGHRRALVTVRRDASWLRTAALWWDLWFTGAAWAL